MSALNSSPRRLTRPCSLTGQVKRPRSSRLAQTGTVPIQHLESIVPPVGEHKQMTRQGYLLQGWHTHFQIGKPYGHFALAAIGPSKIGNGLEWLFRFHNRTVGVLDRKSTR